MRSCLSLLTALFATSLLVACSPDKAAGPPKDATEGETPGNDAGPGDTPDAEGPAPDGGPGEDPDSGTPPPPPKRQATNETVTVDGAARQFILTVPTSYDAARSYPLIIAIHGDGQNAAGFAASSKLEDVTVDDAIVAYTDQATDLFADRDPKFVEAIVTKLKESHSIDASKIWGFGYSKGAYQLNEIACRRPGVLTAMAIHAGGAPQPRKPNGQVNCPTAVALPTFVTHGGNDGPGGGEFGAMYWAGLAGCQNTRTKTTPDICEAYDGCSAGNPVVFCVVPNYPHYPLYPDAAAHSWAWFKTL